MTGPTGPAAVSTLQEAEQFAAASITDLLYAVGVSPANWIACWPCAAGADLTVVVDSLQAGAVAGRAAQGEIIPALIEIDATATAVSSRAIPNNCWRSPASCTARAACAAS